MRMFGFCWLGAVVLVASSGPALARCGQGQSGLRQMRDLSSDRTGRQDPGRAGA